MNLLFGKIGAPEAVQAAKARLIRLCSEHHGQNPSVHELSDARVFGYCSDGGRTFGVAESNEHLLLFNGFFYSPFPSSSVGESLEYPNRAAAVLLDRFQRHGPRFLDGLIGYYSLVVVAKAREEAHLASDPYGQRSLFLQTDGRSLVFSSNLAAAVRLLEAPSIDRSWEDFLLVYGFLPHGRTPFTGIRAVPPGHLLTWADGAFREQHQIAAHIPSSGGEPPVAPTLGSAVESLHDGFLQALEHQCAQSGDVGVLLGGFDSALVAAGLRRLGKRVTTWSFHYKQAEYNQPHTTCLSEFLGTEHHWVPIELEDIRVGLRQFPYVFNQPTNWPNYVIQTALVCRKMKDAGIPIAYSGDGCDTIFLGYPGTWRRARLLESLPSLPGWAAHLGASVAARPNLERRLGHPYRVLLNLVRTSAWPRHARSFLSFRLMDEISLQQLRADAPSQERALRDIVEELAQPHKDLPSLRLAYLGKSLVSPNKNKMNGSTDATGVPILSPYMHPAFKRLAQSLPEELCRPNSSTPAAITGKYALMLMAEQKRLLPETVIYQKKMAAVDAPIDQWYAGPLRRFMLDQLAALPFEPNHDYVEQLLAPHVAERLFQKYFLVDKVIKHAPSLLVTYAAFCALASDCSTGQHENMAGE